MRSLFAQAERRRQATKHGLVVRSKFSPARAQRPVVDTRQLRAARTAVGSPWALQLPQQVAEQFSPAAFGARMRALLRQRFEGLAAKPGRIPGGTGS